MLTRCDAGTEAHATGSKRGPVEVATAGAFGSQARAGPAVRSAVEGDEQLTRGAAPWFWTGALLFVRPVNAG
jgi:hypothetical protein